MPKHPCQLTFEFQDAIAFEKFCNRTDEDLFVGFKYEVIRSKILNKPGALANPKYPNFTKEFELLVKGYPPEEWVGNLKMVDATISMLHQDYRDHCITYAIVTNGVYKNIDINSAAEWSIYPHRVGGPVNWKKEWIVPNVKQRLDPLGMTQVVKFRKFCKERRLLGVFSATDFAHFVYDILYRLITNDKLRVEFMKLCEVDSKDLNGKTLGIPEYLEQYLEPDTNAWDYEVDRVDILDAEPMDLT